ncbi:MAG: hypothetical protein KatS3mg131_2493 [Candidatus Tectimicrobiota bacterium]|nr:MAG: hypothetical protein KatS3mg131_2493 [Candidatus Tectomicrobia bacterium]
MAPLKTHRTAVVAIPPAELWEPIQAIRRRHDRQVRRWMPHITLLYPFVPPSEFASALPELAAACATIAPFTVTLATFRYFVHARGTATLWLAPQPPQPLVALQAALQARFPAYDEQSRFAGGFTPHLSVGQAPSLAAARHLLAQLQATWQPLCFQLTAVALICREARGPFGVHAWLPLGPSSAALGASGSPSPAPGAACSQKTLLPGRGKPD